MLHVACVMVGKTELLWEPLMQEYLRKLKPLADVETIVVKEETCRDEDKDRAIKAEEKRLQEKIDSRDFCVLLDPKGQALSSEGMAELIRLVWEDRQYTRLSFVVGGPFGLRKQEWSMAKRVVRFSDMVLTHQMVRVLLLEQIYRGFQILRGTQYHK